MPLYTFSPFPSGIAPKSVKDTKKYGKEVARAILGSTQDQITAFKAKLFTNRKYADGNQTITEYLDELEIDGKNMYTNIAFRPRPIAPKFIEVVVNGYLQREEYPTVTATSKHIKDRKDKKKSDAQFRMEYGDVLNQLSQEAGVPLTDENEFTPTSKEENDLHFSLDDKEKEELLMQEMVAFAINDNDIESLKNYALADQFVAELHGYYNYIDDNGRWVVDYIQPEDAVIDNSRYDNFKDSSFKGRFIRKKIVDIRNQFKLKPEDEEELWKCAMSSLGVYGNPSGRLGWSLDYRYAETRPYDNYTVELLHFWWRTSKVLNYVEGKDRYNREVFDTDYNTNATEYKSDGRKKAGVKYPTTAYEGYFSANGNLCLSWGEQRNILRKGEDKQELLSPFIYMMPRNKGRMLPNSLMHSMIDSIRVMDIAVLKIKQIIAKSTPDDMIIDIAGLSSMDLGTGDLLQPLDIQQIHAQTGRLYWNSKNEDGTTQNQAPIRAGLNPLDTKLQAFINIYNTELGNIRDYLGVNEFRDGSGTAPRTGFKFMQAQSEASNTATWFIYRAYVKSTEELVRQAGIRIWDALNYGDVNKGYLKYLGKQNIEFIQNRKEITSSSYDINFKLGMTQEDKQVLERYVEIAIGNGSLQLSDALLLNRIKDPQLAEKMLTYLTAKRRKEAMEEADANQKAAANYTAMAGKEVESAKQQSVQMQLEAEMQKEKTRGDNEQIALMVKGAMALIEQSFATGVPIPEIYSPIVQLAIQNAAGKTELSLVATQQEQEAMIQQEEQAQLADELSQAVQSGELDEEQAMRIAQENGLA